MVNMMMNIMMYIIMTDITHPLPLSTLHQANPLAWLRAGTVQIEYLFIIG